MGAVTDDTALAALCRDEHPRLVGLVALYVGNRAVAEDLAQETLIRLHQHWPRVRMMDSPHGWLCGVAVNLARSWWRRRYAEHRANRRHQAGCAPDGEAAPGRGDDPPEPDTVLAVRAAVAGLPPRQRAALVLRFYAGLSVAETARQMGCAEGTVKSLTHKALAALRSRLAMTQEDIRA